MCLREFNLVPGIEVCHRIPEGRASTADCGSANEWTLYYVGHKAGDLRSSCPDLVVRL